jgi:MSHA biogenesis protein MshK
MATSLIKHAAAAAILLLGAIAQAAEPLPDPTRPAPEFLAPAAAADSAKAMATTEGLRTIIIAPDRRSAVINGEQVKLGGRIGGERLMAVCEDSVVLQGAEGRREVPLYPGVVMQSSRIKRCNTPMAKPAATAAPVARKKPKRINHKTPPKVAGKKEKSCE